MTKKLEAYHCPPKRLSIPADLIPLGGHAMLIRTMMVNAHRWRMTEGVKLGRRKERRK